MLKGMKKHEDKEQSKTIKHEATPNKNNTGTTALERSVAKTTGVVFNCRQTSAWVPMYFLIQKYIKSARHRMSIQTVL